MRQKSLTDQRNDTLAGALTNSDMFNLPIKSMVSGFNSVACCDIFYAFCHLLILCDLGPKCFLGLSAGGTCI